MECDEHGWVKVDERLATNIPGIWVAGDIRGGPMFTHTSWDDYRILESQMAGDGSRTTGGSCLTQSSPIPKWGGWE